jgi:hypothetical protein
MPPWLQYFVTLRGPNDAGIDAGRRCLYEREKNRQRSIDMILHPSIHFEIARRRQQDLLARAERDRIAQAIGHTAAWPTLRRRQGEASASSKPEMARHPEVEVGLEV